MKKIRLLAGLMLAAAMTLASACGAAEKEPLRLGLLAMNTYMEIRAYEADDTLMSRVKEQIALLESQMSVTDDQSEIYRLNAEGSALLSRDAQAVLEAALELCRKTEGALDISVYPIVREWGFTTGQYSVPDDSRLELLLENVDYSRVEISGNHAVVPQGMMVDLGSVAKGYTGDQIAKILAGGGVDSALINLGGNVQAVGARPDGSPWRIGVKSPMDEGNIGVLSVEDKAVVTSAGYERYFQDEDGNIYWHIIDPKTGRPAQSGLSSVTVIADQGLYCDGLSTALFVMGKEDALDFWRQYGDFEAILVTQQGEVFVTEGVEKSFVPEGDIEVNVVRRGTA